MKFGWPLWLIFLKKKPSVLGCKTKSRLAISKAAVKS
jgi:hypothetical protein